MYEWWWLVLSGMIGAAFGVFIVGLCSAASRADQYVAAYLAADMCRQCRDRGDVDPAYLFDAQKGERECSHGR